MNAVAVRDARVILRAACALTQDRAAASGSTRDLLCLDLLERRGALPRWERLKVSITARLVSGCTVGMMAMGALGTAVARRLGGNLVELEVAVREVNAWPAVEVSVEQALPARPA